MSFELIEGLKWITGLINSLMKCVGKLVVQGWVAVCALGLLCGHAKSDTYASFMKKDATYCAVDYTEMVLLKAKCKNRTLLTFFAIF